MYPPISLEDWRAKGETFGYRGHDIFHVKGGDWSDPAREALVLIHGFPTSSWDWAHLWGALSERYRLAALDMIGFGFSAKPRSYTYSIQDQADLHECWMDRLGLTRVHILAHDYGDTVAQELLARFMDRRAAGGEGVEIASVCFLNGGLFPEQHRDLHPAPAALTARCAGGARHDPVAL
jgi:pimeloyl-ACP methyl ester carboxylesterase